MGKKKSNSRAKRKENNLKANSQSRNSENAQKKTYSENENNTQKTAGYQPQPAPKLTVYTIVAMLTSLVAAGATALALVILAKPVYYAAEAFFGDSLDSIYYDVFVDLATENGYDKSFVGMLVGAAVLVIIAALISLIVVTRAINPDNKPVVVPEIIAVVCSGVTIALYFAATSYINGKMAELGLEHTAKFGIYRVYMIALIANAVLLLCNVFATMSGRARWNKDGKAF